MAIVDTTPDGIPIRPDVPGRLTSPPGVPSEPTIWYGDAPVDRDDDRIAYALFSGGDDSLVSTHMALTTGMADAVLYLNTNTGLAENLRYVRAVCRRFGWPLRVEAAPVSLVEIAMKYGFPGTAYHTIAYAYLKERQLSTIAGEYAGAPEYISGVRRFESTRRMENIADDRTRVDGKESRWVWLNVIKDYTDDDVTAYHDAHGLPRNPVAERLHRSGDCYCGAFAHRDELFIDLYGVAEDLRDEGDHEQANAYARHATWLRAVEARVQIYRGRLAIFEADYPDVYAAVDERRDRYNPKPMRISVARELYPDVADEINGIPKPTAIGVGRHDPRTYWGHGKMSNPELQSLLADYDPGQIDLCRFCDDPIV